MIKLTKKEVQENFACVSFDYNTYCRFEEYLNAIGTRFFTSGVYGWNCNVYIFNDSIVLTAGYRPFGKRLSERALYELEKDLEKVKEGFKTGKLNFNEYRDNIKYYIFERISWA